MDDAGGKKMMNDAGGGSGNGVRHDDIMMQSCHRAVRGKRVSGWWCT